MKNVSASIRAFTRSVSPSKKRRRSQSNIEVEKTARAVVRFTTTGLEPDTRFVVFDHEFLLHSAVLKLHSSYFRNWLSPPEKARPGSSPLLYRYEYMSVVNGKGDWVLEPTAQVASKSLATFQELLNSKNETEVFRKLLCALYGRPYTVKNVGELKRLTDLAELYGALPILSATLTSALIGSPMFSADVHRKIMPEFLDFVFDILPMARKLRHPVLFRECFVHVVGRWPGDEPSAESDSEIEEMIHIDFIRGDPVLSALVEKAHHTLCKNLLLVNQDLLYMIFHQPQYHFNGADALCLGRQPVQNVGFYKSLQRQLKSDPEPSREAKELIYSLDYLLASRLILDRSGCGAGDGPYAHVFLSTELSDSDLPWDTQELEW